MRFLARFASIAAAVLGFIALLPAQPKTAEGKECSSQKYDEATAYAWGLKIAEDKLTLAAAAGGDDSSISQREAIA